MNGELLPNGEQQFFDNNGDPLALGTVTFCVPNTDTLKATWQNQALSVLNTNPVALDDAGRAIIWGSGTYRQIVKDALDNTIWDQTTSALDPQAALGIGITRAQIATSTLTVSTFQVIGYSTAGDLGTGAIFTSHGAGSGGPSAIQDAAGTWFQLVLNGTAVPGWFGAKGDGTTNDSAPINAAISAVDSGVLDISSATYLGNGITTNDAMLVGGNGSIIKSGADSVNVLTVDSTLSLQSDAQMTVQDLSIDGNGHTGVSGISGSLLNTTPYMGAQFIGNNISVKDCAVGIYWGATQFGQGYDLQAYNCSTGMIIQNDSVSGGGNSNSIYGPHFVSCTVGLFVNGTNFTSVNGNNFYNLQILSNTVCGAAFFNSVATIYGSSPENNAGGATTAIVNGLTVKRSSFYLNSSSLDIFGIAIEEASATPCFLIEDGSVLSLHDVSGYGNAAGFLVNADSSSVVHLNGNFACLGTVQNVATWPSSISVQAGQSILYGLPLLAFDQSVAALYAAQAPTFLLSVTDAPSSAVAEDSQLQYCRSIGYNAEIGNTNKNHVRVSFGSGTADCDTVISVLLKPDRDCALGFNFNDGAAFNDINGTATLFANQVTRLVLTKAGIVAGTWTIYFYAADTTGPTIEFANLQCWQGTTGEASTIEQASKIVSMGSFDPGPTRATAAVFGDKASAINTFNKYPGKQGYSTDDNRFVIAAAATDVGIWKDGSNSTVYTPS